LVGHELALVLHALEFPVRSKVDQPSRPSRGLYAVRGNGFVT
jgi:hypothetical protein